VLTLLPSSEFDRRIGRLSDEQVWREYYVPAGPARVRRQAFLRGAVDAQPGERVLDVGCGAGSLAYWAAGRGARVVGIDYSAASVAVAARLGWRLGACAPAYLVASALALPVADDRFDTVVSVDVLDVLPAPAHAAFVRGLVAAVRPGGRVLLYTPNGVRERLGRRIRPLRRLAGRWRHGESALHIGLATPGGVRGVLGRLGVTARVRYTDINHPWVARIPIARRWLAGHMLWTITKPPR
jgi:2-polyprenyl-3-methyl-5-hydroxy-6-metoxy-1,4-benzoquinol methylase